MLPGAFFVFRVAVPGTIRPLRQGGALGIGTTPAALAAADGHAPKRSSVVRCAHYPFRL